jgi:hypothetical protein
MVEGSQAVCQQGFRVCCLGCWVKGEGIGVWVKGVTKYPKPLESADRLRV